MMTDVLEYGSVLRKVVKRNKARRRTPCRVRMAKIHQFGHREEGHQKATVRSFAEEGQKGQGAHRRPATASSSFLYNLKNTPRRRARREVADKVPPAEDLKFVPGTRSDETGLDWAARRNPARQKVRTTTCVAICWPGSQAQGTVFSAPPAAKAGRLRLTIKAHQSQLF